MQMGSCAPASIDLSSARFHRGVTPEALSNLCQQGQLTDAVEALGVLVQSGCRISKPVFYTVFQTCVVNKDMVLGRRVHALSVKQGYESDTFLCNHILRMYASQGRLQEAMDVFTAVAKPNVFMWSSIVHAHVKQGQGKQAIQLYQQMRRSTVRPDGHVFVAALQACAREADLKTGELVHADVMASGVEPDEFVCSCLVDMYVKCGSLEDAQRVFDALPRKNVVTWTALIVGYSQQGMGQEALGLYRAMQQEGIAAPDAVTFVCLLQACASVGIPALETGRELHLQIREQGFQADISVANSLIVMYMRCCSLRDAQSVFDELDKKDVVTWNAMIAGYSQQGMGHRAFHFYDAMQEGGIFPPDSVTFVCLLQACASVGAAALEKGKQLHVQIGERGLQLDVVLGCSLVNMYAKCGSLEDAQCVFDSLPQKNVVTWTALISGYSQQGMGEKALRLYSSMQREGIAPPDSVTFVCLLQACASVAALHAGRQLHAQIEQQRLQADVFVAISLINMYAKAGSIADAQQVFDALPEKDLVAWNALIAGYTSQGDSEAVFDLVHRMREDGIQADGISYLSLLTACSHAGAVNKGRGYFEAMRGQYGISPTMEHYSCMVDLLGRAGHLEDALTVVRAMPEQPDDAVWHTLLGACRKWSNVKMGRYAFHEAVKLDKKDVVAYVLMANIYTGAQMWKEALEIQEIRKQSCAWTEPGQSWWTDMDGLVHSFLVADHKHPESEAIYASLKHLVIRIENGGCA